MAEKFRWISWTPYKKVYDLYMGISIVIYLLIFFVVQLFIHPEAPLQMTLIRGTSTLAFFMLHVILSIGPLSRLDPRFLPLLYNRRHLGVTFFFVALVHAGFSAFYYHGLGNENMWISIFTSNTHYESISRFPFQILGFMALIILFFMAITSHDWWLAKIGAVKWKYLHMMVYVAYVLVLGHVTLGILQTSHPIAADGLVLSGFLWLGGIHVISGIRSATDRKAAMIRSDSEEPFKFFCHISEIKEGRAKVGIIGGEEIAVFKHDRRLSAVHNACKHQGGPLGEGRVIDGCITCPWHGYQYLPENGQSPPPFTEKLKKYILEIREQEVWIDPNPLPEGSHVTPVECSFDEGV
jgi:DMSO/TMAO reductase YedYZ heme-binding membrane subunit/nitrite reductase/ring-hydroxylating ferredoxin subunit